MKSRHIRAETVPLPIAAVDNERPESGARRVVKSAFVVLHDDARRPVTVRDSGATASRSKASTLILSDLDLKPAREAIHSVRRPDVPTLVAQAPAR